MDIVGQYRTRLFPWKTKVALAIGFVLVAAFGDRMIYGYFWLVQRAGDAVTAWLR